MPFTGTTNKLVDPRDLLETLRQHPLTSPFRLALYTEQHGRKGLIEAIQTVCPACRNQDPCDVACFQDWQESISLALLTNQPVVRSCAQGGLFFSTPLTGDKELPDCLLGGGLFEQDNGDRPRRRNHAKSAIDDLIDELEAPPPLISKVEAEGIVEEIFRALPRLIEQQSHTLGLTRTTQRLEAVQKLSRELSDCEDSERAVTIVSEALVIIFDLPKVLIIQQQPGSSITVHSTLGLEPDEFQLGQNDLADYFGKSPRHPQILSAQQSAGFFPGLDSRCAYLFPLSESDTQLGAIAILDIDLHGRDQALIELLVSHLATRLARLRTAAGHLQERKVSERLVSMISALALADSRQELYAKILEMSAELLNACRGSLMLLDESDGSLRITAAKGLAEPLANTMTIAFGEGIAGRVAKSGFPMLVNDIERDKRVAVKNRPRFKTKSFLCMPLEVEGRLVGVLNLADKENGSNFTEADLHLIQTFTRHAVLLIDRAATLEKVGKFELLAITDPLTGLYNRRLLQNRLQEEFSRSTRYQQSFCLILADLDNFKIYNDLCGHLAGDNALRKAAELIQRSAREIDVVTRYGGEEFCLILPGTGKKESTFVGERIRWAIEAESFPGESLLPLGRLTISLGIATFPVDGSSAEELIHAADLALYQAKAMGRNRLVFFEPSLAEQSLLSHP